MTLTRFDYQWNAFLKSENCPPILGLVPLPEGQYVAVSALIAGELNRTEFSSYETLLYLMDRYPSILAIWIARKSGQAYDAGAFWDRLSEETDVVIPPNSRANFTFAFRRACRHSMGNYTEPKELGTRKYVEILLYQAGIPLDQCRLYAQMLRRIERQHGLPDPNSDESGEELRETMLGRSELAGHPMLHKALRGPAGAYLCEAALNSVSNPDFAGINPRLRDELSRTFEHEQVRRAARPPFVRLGEDYCSLEIVGPRQDEQTVASGTPEWRVDGQRYWVSRSDELVVPVADQTRVTVELRGLSGGLTLLRSFVLNLREREQSFMLFDYESRRLQREANVAERIWYLKSGDYWLLHTMDATVSAPEQDIEWPDGERRLSLIRIQPGKEVRLETGGGAVVSFKPDLWPFLEPNGEILSSANEQPIHYGWQNLPIVWLPSEDITEAHDAVWGVRGIAGGLEYSWPLIADPAMPSQDGMVPCTSFGASLLAELAPGLYEVEITVFQGSRAKVDERFLYWAGLRRVFPASEFVVSALPNNLERSLCEGFACSERTITHLRDRIPEHTLAFVMSGGHRFFRWSQAGTFLYSAEKRPGARVQWMFHPLGQSFPASLDSSRWLRIRREPVDGADLLIVGGDGRSHQHLFMHSFMDLSLAELATRFPSGGRLLVRRNGLEAPVARFTRPLVPEVIDFLPNSESVTLRCWFPDQVRFVRPKLCELITGRVIEYDFLEPASQSPIVFRTEGLPEIVCSTFDSKVIDSEAIGRPVEVHVPQWGWPSGLWVVQIEVRQNEMSDWQLVTDQNRREVAVLVNGPPSERLGSFRATQFHRAYATAGYRILEEDVSGHEAELCDLLTEIQTFMRHGFAESVRPQFQWFDSLYRELGKHAGRVLSSSDAATSQRLLNLACQETQLISGRSLFVSVPRLLALPAEGYSEIPTNQALPKCLQWCGRLARKPSVLVAFKESIETGNTWALTLASHFGNFSRLARTEAADAEDDLSGFRYVQYRNQTIGALAFWRRDDIPQQPEWDDKNVFCRVHIEWALSELARRRQDRHYDMNLGAVNRLFHASADFRRWIRNRMADRAALMPAAIWETPWLPVTVDDDDFMENCSRFASLLALAARTSAFGSLDFDAAIAWLSERIGSLEITERTLATLVGMAPELVGYYLMFWELMIRTYPHE